MLIAGLFLSICAIALSIAYYTYRICFYSPTDRTEDPYDSIAGEQYQQINDLIRKCTIITEKTPFQWVKVSAFDGIKLYGRYYHKIDGAPLLILFHGYRSCTLRDCSGGFILAHRLGFNVLAVDQRGHGRSGGVTISFGILERYDCLEWAKYAAKHLSCGAPILLSGLSMGAATVLMAAQLPLPKAVVGILADCPYSSPKEIIKKVCADKKIPANLVYPFLWLGAKLFGSFNLNGASAVGAIPYAKVPILLYHGEDDRYVPYEMSQLIYDSNCENCTLHTFPVAGHGLCYMVDPLRYEKVTYDFLNNIPEIANWLSMRKDNDIFFDNSLQQ